MKRAVLFDYFSLQCPYCNPNTEVNNGYGCDHPRQEDKNDENGKEQGCCHIYSCPLGIEAEQQDLTDPENEDAVTDEIDWDGLCEDGEVSEGEYFLINSGIDATEDERNALYSYERYMHRYDKKWLDKHGIANSLAR